MTCVDTASGVRQHDTRRDTLIDQRSTYFGTHISSITKLVSTQTVRSVPEIIYIQRYAVLTLGLFGTKAGLGTERAVERPLGPDRGLRSLDAACAPSIRGGWRIRDRRAGGTRMRVGDIFLCDDSARLGYGCTVVKGRGMGHTVGCPLGSNRGLRSLDVACAPSTHGRRRIRDRRARGSHLCVGDVLRRDDSAG